MDYHVNRQGQNLGVFPLEEVRSRRRSGEFDGTELVWTGGMAEWRHIDAVLQDPGSARPAPPPIPAGANQRRTSPAVPWLIALAVVGFFGAMAFVAFQTAKVVRSTLHGAKPSASGRAGDPVAIVSRPLVWGTNSSTVADVNRRAKAFRERQWLEGYKQRGERSPAYDAAALKFLESWIAQIFTDRATTNYPEVQALGDELATNAACNEPLLLALSGANCLELHEAIHRLDRAWSAFDQSHHRAYPRFYTAVTLAANLREDAPRARALERSALEYFREALTDGSFEPGDQPELGEILVNGWGAGFFSRHSEPLLQALKGTGGKYEWLLLTLQGEHEVKMAWQARGSGWGSTVTSEGWRGFEQHLKEATRYFTAAWKLRPDLPLAPSRMISVAMGNSGLEEMRTWFDRALAAQMDYPGAWSSMRWGLRPRWDGNLDAMLELGVQAVNTRRFDTDVPRKFLDVVADLETEQEIPAGRHIYGQDDIWPRLREVYEGYVREPKQAEWRNGWRSSYTAVAFLAGKYDVARQQLEALNWKPAPQNLSGWERDLSLLPEEVAARTGNASNEVASAEAAYSRRSTPEAARSYSELANRADLDERTRQFVQHRVAALEMEKRFRTGDWVDFLPASAEDPAWDILDGTCRRLPDGAWEVESGPKGHLLYCRARVGSDFEVRGSFDVERSSTKSFQAGLVLGLPEVYAHDWDAFRIKRNDDEGQVASFSYAWSQQQISRPVELDGRHNSFEFRIRAGQVSATVNGKEVFKNAKPPRVLRVSRRQMLLGLGAFNDMNNTVIRYRDLQVRKLTATTAPTETQ